MTDPLAAAAAKSLADRDAAGLLRRREIWTPTGPVTAERDGRAYVNFASNNYLGLTHHPRLLAAARNAVDESVAVGSGAAGLISGHTAAHARAEKAIADWKGCAAAVLLPSGYQANLAVVQTLAALGDSTGGVRFLIDKLAHASLLDAVRLTGQSFRVFPHNGLPKLERLLAAAPADELQVVLTESVFSMDGEAADLAGLAKLKAGRPFVLVVDEAHASGVYGPAGSGLVNELGLRAAVDVTIVTLSKALGLSGAAVCGSADFVRAVENFGRAYVFSTSVSPLAATLAAEAVSICRDEPHLGRRVRATAAAIRRRLIDAGRDVTPGDSPILPLIIGDATAAVAAAAKLREAGLLVVAVRPPTVPPNTSRLRVTFSAAHTDDQIDRLIAALTSGPLSHVRMGEG